MKRKIVLILTIALTSWIPMTQAQDAKSTPVIQKLNEKLKSSTGIKANFFTLYNNAKGETRSKFTGELTIKGDKYIIDMGSHKIYNNGAQVFTYLVNAKEVQITTYKPETDPISPATLFSGDFISNHTYSYLGEKTIAGRQVHHIELKPKKANKSYVRLELFVDAVTSEMSGGNLYEKNGNFYSISITKLNSNAKIPDAAFTLDVKGLAGVEVIHLK